jgi:type VI protein secretion system component Hcp
VRREDPRHLPATAGHLKRERIAEPNESPGSKPIEQPTTPAPAPAGATIFVKLGDIKGDSTAANHKNEIPAEALDYGFASSFACHGIHFRAAMSKATPLLDQHAAGGRPVEKAEITMEKPVHGEQQSVFTLTLTNVRVQAVHSVLLSGFADGRPAPWPYDDVTLVADKYTIRWGTTSSVIDCVNRRLG